MSKWVPVRYAKELEENREKLQQSQQLQTEVADWFAAICMAEGFRSLAGKALLEGSNSQWNQLIRELMIQVGFTIEETE